MGGATALAHLVVVYVASRVAGLRATLVEATVIVALLGLGAAAARRREPGAHEDDLGTSPRNGDLRKDEAMEPAERTGSMR